MALKQNNQELTKEQIDNMSQEDWDALPIVSGQKPPTPKQFPTKQVVPPSTQVVGRQPMFVSVDKQPIFETDMKDFKLNTQERRDEYTRRKWEQDETTSVKPIQLDLSDKSLPKGMNAKMDLPKLEAEKPKNNAIKITEGLLRLLSPGSIGAASLISGAARSMYSKLNNK